MEARGQALGRIAEISSDPALRAYGAALALTHALSFVVWRTSLDLVRILGERAPLCWPFFASCHRLRPMSPEAVRFALDVYLASALVTAALFSKERWTRAGWWALLALQLFQLAIVFQDYQLRLNQHLMSTFATLTFLFARSKRAGLKLLVACFYFWAGLLKLGPEWLSGAALYRPIWIFHGALLPWATGFVVLLETALVWGLLSTRRWIFWPVLACFVAFHLFSWPVVGFFYPTLMFCLLSIYPLDRYFADGRARGPLRDRAFTAAIAFSALQLAPRFFPGDGALTGEGRLFAVHMFDARVQCEARAVLKRGAAREEVNLVTPLAPRIRCDPVVFWNRARALCRARDRDFDDLDLEVRSKRSTSAAFTRVIDVGDFCATMPEYSVLHHNDWIEAP